jgi:hypothetical protein
MSRCPWFADVYALVTTLLLSMHRCLFFLVPNFLCPSRAGAGGPVKCGLGSGSGFTLRARAFAALAWPGGHSRGLDCRLSPKTRPARTWAFGL